jgi:glycosyltransferase involved in cell wall biosynthesis
VLHSHLDYFPLSLLTRQNVPFLTTLHGRLDLPDFIETFGTFRSAPFVSISDNQRKPVPDLNWIRTVPHGLPAGLLRPLPVKQEYAAFLGRISPEKGIDKAIRIAGRAGMKLRIAAKVDNVDKEYYNSQIRPLIEGNPDIEFIGEINDQQKSAFLSAAHTLLFPIDWPEPFGLVMIESMACGTPVIAFNRGAVPEVVDEGVSGFIVEDEIGAVAAVNRLHTISREGVRKRFEQRFTSHRMAKQYVEAYQAVVRAQRRSRFKLIDSATS